MSELRFINAMNAQNGGGNLLSSAVQQYVTSQLAQLGNFDTRVVSSRWNRLAQRSLKNVVSAIDDWRVSHRYIGAVSSNFEQGVSSFDNGGPTPQQVSLPFKKNGEVSIVFTTAIGDAGFNSDLNAVMINPTFARLLSENKIYYLAGPTHSTRVPISLQEVVLHEIGHRSDGRTMSDAQSHTNEWRDHSYDDDAEILEAALESLDGKRLRGPHDILYVDVNGANVPFSLKNASVRAAYPGLISEAQAKHIFQDEQGRFYVATDATGGVVQIGAEGGKIGYSIGSALGQFIVSGHGPLVQIGTSTVLGSIGQAFGNALQISIQGDIDLSQSFDAAFANFDSSLFANLKSNAAGALTAFTTMELGRVIGLKGFGAELFGFVAGSAVNPVYNEVINNIAAGHLPFDHFSLSSIFGGNASFDATYGPSIGAFFGSKLGSLVVQPTTQAGALLSSIGSSVGSIVASKVLSGLGNIVAPGVGAFVGFVLGTLIGNLFGHHKPRIPSASAETILQIPYARYGIGAEVSANGGDLAFADAMARAARDTLNGLVDQITGTPNTLFVANVTSLTQTYGYSGNQVYVKLGGARVDVTTADEAVEKGVLWALPQTQIVGGDIILKRTIGTSLSRGLTAFLGDLQVAADYRNYLRNRVAINSLIKDQPNSIFSASWAVTLGRVAEIGLNNFAASDFYGGLQGFLQSFGVSGAGSAVHYEDISASLSGGALTLVANGGYGAGLFSLLPQSVGSGAAITITSFGAQIGYVEQYIGNRSTASDIEIAAPGSGAVTVYAGSPGYYNGYYGSYPGNDGGSDIIVGAGGNDYLAAGSGGDWIDGQSGDDQIYGGSGADVLLGGGGNDHIAAGGGRDYLAGGDGDDSLDGEGSADVLVGGAGSDMLHGGDGDDVLLADEDGGGTYDILDGGNGNDTVSFERFSSGVTADISAQAPSNVLTVQQAGFTLYRNQAVYSPDGRYRFIFQSDQNLVLYGPGNAVLWAANTRNSGGYRVMLSPDGNLVMYKSNGSIRWQSYSGGHSGATMTLDNAGQLNIDDQDGTAYWTIGGGGYVAPVTSSIYGDQWQSIENITGSNYDDHLTGTNYGSTLRGLGGDDVLTGGNGDDVLEGGDGSDALNGGGGINSASYAHSVEGIYVSLLDNTAVGGDAVGDTFSNIQNLIGSTSDDELTGDGGINTIRAGFGDDWIDATTGSDTYDGGDGFDTVDYSATSFVSGTSTFEYGGYPYTYTSPALIVTVSDYGSSASYRDADGSSGYHVLNSIEQVIGTSSDDSFSSAGSSISVTWNGGAGADTFSGGDGSDTYVFGHGYGTYAISDTSAASNTLRLNSDVSFDDLWVGNAGGTLQVGIRGESGYMSVSSNFASGNDVIKTLDLGGAGHADLTQIGAVYGGSDGGEGISGDSSTANLIFAYGGDDTIYAANGTYSYQGSVIYAGLGNDTVVTSVGDDQFLFERGNGHDYIVDGGGQNTVVFGSTVAADDVIYEVVGNDLFIGIKDLNNSNLTASQVADTLQIVGGAVKNVGTTYGTTSWNTAFSLEAGGATTDLTKANVAWVVNYYDDSNQGGGGGYYYGGGGGGYIPPIILDLTGDGLEITPVGQSDIVTKDAAGNVLRTSWVGPTNGILAYDRNGDGRIDNTADISFKGDRKGARTDLEGLAGWDENGDGVLNAFDTGFAKLVVWTDTNQNGQQDLGEVMSLLAAGVTSIDLKGRPTGFDGKDTIDTIVRNTTSFTRLDGSSGTAYDVALARRALSDGAASSILGVKGLGSVAAIGKLADDPLATATGKGLVGTALTAAALGVPADVQTGGTSGATVDAASAVRWASVLDPTLRAARKALFAGGMQGEELLAAIRSSRAHDDAWTTLYGRALRTASTRMQAIVIDFDRTGPDFVDPTTSRALIDASHTGTPVQVGWLKGSDGVLAYDADGNGRVDVADEVDLTGKAANAKTAFQGLRAFDTDKDGSLSAADSGFAKFLIWRDRNGNGESDAGEVQSLAQAGIARFDLTGSVSRSAFGSGAANEVLGVGKVVFTDGSTRATYDVALGFADADRTSDPAPRATPVAKTSLIEAASSDAPSIATDSGAAPGVATSAALVGVGRSRGSLSGPSADVVTADVASGATREWWRDPGMVGAEFAALAAPTLSSDRDIGANRTSLATANVDAAQLQRLMLLRQNMAAMHGEAGGAAAIWTRGAANDAALAIPASVGNTTVVPGSWSRAG